MCVCTCMLILDVFVCTLVGSIATLAVCQDTQDAGLKPTRDSEQIFTELIENGKQTPRRGASLLVNKKGADININILVAFFFFAAES